MVKPALHSEKGGTNILRALLTIEKYETRNYDVSGMRRYSWNILQWNKNDTNSMKMTNGDYSFCSRQHPNSGKNIQQIGFGMNVVLQITIASSDDPN